MVDTTNSAGATIEERSDLGSGDVATYAYWMGQEKIAEKEERKWVKRSREIVKRYRDERPDSPNASQSHRFNILWSNVQTLKPTLYARTPKPDVERRFKDQDDVGRLAATILERAISYQLECGDFDTVMTAVVEDRLLPGRGIARVLYVPQFGDVLQEENPRYEEEEEEDVNVASEGDELPREHGEEPQQAEKLREVVYEECVPSYVFWEDYTEGPARTWKEVPWTRYRAYLTRDELVKRFKAKGKLVNLDYTPNAAPEVEREEIPRDMFKKAVVHEYWDKAKKQVVWLAPGTPDVILDTIDDPLGLKDFFPNPDPLLATTTTNKRIPVPDYIEYRDQALEMDKLTGRIDKLTGALRVSGVYAGESKAELQQLIDEGTENKLIPVKDWAAFMEKGGLEGLISWLPIKTVAETLIQLYDARERVKDTLYEITGLSDILRGQSQPIETLGAQELKSNFATRRIYPQQQQVARFARDIIRLIGQVICLHFEPQTLSKITGFPQLDPLPQVPPPPQQQPQLGLVGPDGAPPQPNPQFAQAMQQWQQAQAQAQQVQASNAAKQQAFDAAVKLLREDGLEGFRLDIEADSTIAPDEQAEKAARTEFLGQFIPLMEQMAPLVMGNPPMAELGKELVLFGVRGFKTARPLEEAIEKAFDALAQMPPNPKATGQQQPKASGKSPEEIQADVAMQQSKAQVAQQANNIKLLQVTSDARNDAAKTAMENEFHASQLALDREKLADEQAFRRVRASGIEARQASQLP